MALYLPFYDIIAPQKVPCLKILMTSLHVICGLDLPQSKTLATPMVTMVTYHQLRSHLTS